jgi:hypothetical protein
MSIAEARSREVSLIDALTPIEVGGMPVKVFAEQKGLSSE